MVAILLVVLIGIACITLSEVSNMSQLVDDLVAEVGALKDAVAPLPAAVDALEAAITDLKSKLPDPSDADKLTAALADIKAVKAAVAGAVADATDGVDEAA